MSTFTMEKNEIRENLFQYYFRSSSENDPLGVNNIFACVDPGKNTALVIDTVFPAEARAVKKDLEEGGITVDTVILSHYHPDHAAGCVVFPGCRIFASRHYADNLDNCKRWKPHLTFVPATDLIKNGDTLDYGPFHLAFVETPGHSACGLTTRIGNDTAHVGDLLMYNDSGTITLPYIAMTGSFSRHISSLEAVKAMDIDTVLIPHGKVLTGKDEIEENIDDRLYYLKRVKNSGGSLPVAACLKKDISSYNSTQFHETNCVFLMME